MCCRLNTQRQSGRVAIKIDNIENKSNTFNQSVDSKYMYTKFIYSLLLAITSWVHRLIMLMVEFVWS